MTNIPDDVVEMAANAYGDASGDHYDCLRAALSVAVEWKCGEIVRDMIGQNGTCDGVTAYNRIRARSNPSATE